MKYANEEKSAVICTDNNGQDWTVPRWPKSHPHPMWVKFGIDEAEVNGEIQPATTEMV
ncbi:hypothetical protein [Vibrio sp. HN007]|uniref:hypothetical protein n=1 Tax=Vibrio iocasae TaxID=3098914 RepID=UPI0035D4C1E7